MNSLKYKPIILTILDGWGIAPPSFGNAITSAHTPCMGSLLSKFPNTELWASGTWVGLPNNDPGNTEVGHINISAGRIVKSKILVIDDAITKGSFFTNPAFKKAIDYVKTNSSNLHLIGLFSSARVHASSEHLLNLIKLTKQESVKNLYLHIFTDGRDAPPYEGLTKLLELENYLQKIGIGKIASISGRFYGMDRNKRFERTEKVYDALVKGVGKQSFLATVALENYYKEGISDEFIPPTVITDKNQPVATIGQKDAIIFFNHRGERAVQLVEKFNGPFVVTLTEYDRDLKVNDVAYLPTKLTNTIGEVFSKNNFKQLRLAESEKGRFVTYYFNGHQENPWTGERDLIIDSPKVRTYDELPQMAAPQITDSLIDELVTQTTDFVVVNFANADMVGHTGLFKPTVMACETVDLCLQRIVDAVLKTNGVLFITGDHGNAEEKIDLKTGLTLNEHTKNPVPLILVGQNLDNIKLKPGGTLGDIAPTILTLIGLPVPPEMTGKVLYDAT